MRGRLIVALFAIALAAAPAGAQKFRHDDPVRVDPDDQPIPKPGEIELSTSHDVLYHSFGDRGEANGVPAANVNTLGEVPDSSWFTNRIGVRELSIEELVRGPDTVEGPDPSGPLTVVAGKSQGITPGFTVVDARGDTYFIKFDSVRWPHLATAVDVIGTKFFHAIGYNVPQNFITYFTRDRLRVDPDARFTRGKQRRAMTDADIDEILKLAPRERDASYRVVASRGLPGEPIGHRLFFGTRGDDPNDIFPHEDRRELRGFRIFCAWLNHDDSRALNSLDIWIPKGELGYVKHYLIDFSSTLGAGSDARRQIAPQSRRAGNEYVIELRPMFTTLFSLGLWERPWRKVEYQVYPEVGRIESDYFQPERWKPEYPNPAFRRMQAEDAFWAARIVARFSDEAIRAIVETGRYDDPIAQRFLADQIIARRDKVLDHYLRQLNPIDELALESGELRFAHLGERHGLGRVESYRYRWFAFDNESETLTELGAEATTSASALPVPESDHAFLMARIRGDADAEPGWGLAVDVYVRNAPGRPMLVGIERESVERPLS